MPDETIATNPQTHADQVERTDRTPQAPVKQAPVLPPAPVIAADGKTHADVVKAEKMGDYCPLYGVTSFAELDAVQKIEEATNQTWILTERFQIMVNNIMADHEISDKAAAVTKLTGEFTSRLEQAMKPKEKPGVADWLKQLFTGKKEKEVFAPEAAKPEPPVPSAPFTVWKTKDGQYRWFAIYSNNYRDQDRPPEIISEKSHRAFLDLVDSGTVDYPELWHWHIPGTTWGKADWLDYADGFALASGYIYPGHEKEAEALSKLGDIRVSHGMPSRFIVRSKEDPTIIDFHVTTEISDLPGFAAANPLTEFAVMHGKETDMALTPEKRDYLAKLGLDEGAIKEIEGNLAQKAQAATGLESKETTDPEPTPAAEQPAYTTAQEVASAIADVVKPLTEVLAAISAQQAELVAEVKALKEADDAKIAKAAAATPRASLQELIAASINPIGDPAAAVDGRTTLAKAGPKQAEDPYAGAWTPFNRINEHIAQSRKAVEQ